VALTHVLRLLAHPSDDAGTPAMAASVADHPWEIEEIDGFSKKRLSSS
jgi:hypothetical protein